MFCSNSKFIIRLWFINAPQKLYPQVIVKNEKRFEIESLKDHLGESDFLEFYSRKVPETKL